MNIVRMRHALNEIERLERALVWLLDHGQRITRETQETVLYRPNFAGACNGAKEAGEVLSEIMSNRLPSLIADAVENCRNTIEIHRQTVRDEVPKKGTDDA